MKILFLLPAISLIAISDYPSLKYSSAFQTDTTAIIHILDGNTVEWPTEKFTTDKTTKIRYAVDNNEQMLFLVISIPDKKLQQSVMQQGMSLFVDAKGKKNENRGVEFPIGKNNGPAVDYMKIFGFSNIEPFSQNIKTDGTINIAIALDSSNVMNIEYNIPMKMLRGTADDFKSKKISVGWKIKEDESATNNNTAQPGRVTTTLVGKPTNGSTPITRNVPSANVSQNQVKTDQVAKVQSFWTSYTIGL